MSIEFKIKNSNLLTEKFGLWPKFHDSEVLEFNLSREINGASLLSAFRVFEMTSETNEEGSYNLRYQSLVKILFQKITNLQLSNFNHQNALFGLKISDLPKPSDENAKFEVRFIGAYGVEADFKCETIEVLSVTPYTAEK